MRTALLLSFLLFAMASQAQDIYILKDPGTGHLFLNEGWKYKVGEFPRALNEDFDDGDWKAINPKDDFHDSFPADAFGRTAWMRLRFHVSDKARKQQLALMVHGALATEIYLNGKLLRRYGTIQDSPLLIKPFDPRWKPVPVELSTDSVQVLAVRFAAKPGNRSVKGTTHYGAYNPILEIRVMRYENAIAKYAEIFKIGWHDFFFNGIMFMVFIVHLAFFIMYPKQKANLYFAVSAILTPIASTFHLYYYYVANPDDKYLVANIVSFIYIVAALLTILSIYKFLSRKIDARLIVWLSMTIATFFLSLNFYGWAWFLAEALSRFGLMALIISVAVSSMKSNRIGSLILIAGVAIAIIGFAVFLMIPSWTGFDDEHLWIKPDNITGLFFFLYLIGVPAALSLFLARDFARTSRWLEVKLAEVEDLSAKNLSAEKEKQELLAAQNLKLEEKVADRTKSLENSLKELKATQAQLIQSEKMASLGELTAGIAHEIQNPLNFVNNFSEINGELLKEMGLAMEKKDYSELQSLKVDLEKNMEKITEHGKRADSIVKGMLQHSRTSTGQKEQTDINALCDEYLRLAYHGMRAKDKSLNARLNTNFDSKVRKINVVPQDIGRVLLNLINNALYTVGEKSKTIANGYDPTVSISTREEDDAVSIVVDDNGNGIPEKIKEKIFQPFFTTKPTGQGTGLGLSLSYDMIHAMGGEIRVKSVEGKGSTFTITLKR